MFNFSFFFREVTNINLIGRLIHSTNRKKPTFKKENQRVVCVRDPTAIYSV